MKASIFCAALLAGLLSAGGARADELLKTRPVSVECAAGNKLCRHLSRMLANARTNRGTFQLARWYDPIRYVTEGLSPEGELLFDDLMQGIAGKIGMKVERLPVESAAVANFGLIVSEDLSAMLNSRRFVNAARYQLTPEERAEIAERQKEAGALLLRKARGREMTSSITECYASIPAKRLEQYAALRLSKIIYQCLTGTPLSSNEVRPSLLNSPDPAALDAPPHAKMAAVDRAILQAMYAVEFHPRTMADAVSELERTLRAEGFSDDGLKH